METDHFKVQKEIHKEFIKFLERYQDKLDAKDFIYILFLLMAKVTFDLAHERKDAEGVINEAINNGLQWSLEDKERGE